MSYPPVSGETGPAANVVAPKTAPAVSTQPAPQPAAVQPIVQQPLAAPKGREASATVERPQGELLMFVFTSEQPEDAEGAREGYEIRFHLFPEYAQSSE